MSLMHAILGFLNRQSQTGYSLKNEQFDKSVTYFWPADQTQIYKTLDKLVEEGCATSTIEVQSDRPNRKIYSISRTGKEELKRWVSEAHEPASYRDPLLVQLFFSDCVPASDMIEVLEYAREKHEEKLGILQGIDVPPAAKCTDRQMLLARLTLDFGLQSKQTYIEWIDQAIAAIKALENKNSRAKKDKS